MYTWLNTIFIEHNFYNDKDSFFDKIESKWFSTATTPLFYHQKKLFRIYL